MRASICVSMVLCHVLQIASNHEVQLCRSRNNLLNPYQFRLDSCALCYWYVPNIPNMFTKKWNLTHEVQSNGYYLQEVSFLTNGSHQTWANSSDMNSPLVASFGTRKAQRLWNDCCKSAVDCCRKMMKTRNVSFTNGCPRTWDGWQCWDETPAGEVAVAPCPSYIHFLTEPPTCPNYANKECTSNGTWLRIDGMEWSNYSTCSTVALMKIRVYVRIASYAVSAAFLVPALLIFLAYKQLQVHRVKIHRHLFASLLCNCLFEILFQSIALLGKLQGGNSIIEMNTVNCRLMLILTKYFRGANYVWMFNEALYLHQLLTVAFEENSKVKLVTVFVGWAPVLIYAIIRLLLANQSCWIFPMEHYEWILYAPCLICLLMNIVFLANIVRILLGKLQSSNVKEPAYYRKALRAILLLVPLFGVHFIVTIYRPPSGICEGFEIYYYISILMDGLQGCLVALLFCYCNGEVIYLLKRSFNRTLDRRFPNRIHSGDKRPPLTSSARAKRSTSCCIV